MDGQREGPKQDIKLPTEGTQWVLGKTETASTSSAESGHGRYTALVDEACF